MGFDLAISVTLRSFVVGSRFAVSEDLRFEKMLVSGFGGCARLLALCMCTQRLVEAPDGFVDMKLFSRVDLLIDVVFRLEVDGLEGGLQGVSQ